MIATSYAQPWETKYQDNPAFRADGASSQYIIVLPEQDAVVITTAHDNAMQDVLNLIWDNILPALISL
ncbi:MAG: hypothetical protein MJY92_08065 [Bacteroidales bacterium]|nr:hypothetical protein [Bacteroidales bacterium]